MTASLDEWEALVSRKQKEQERSAKQSEANQREVMSPRIAAVLNLLGSRAKQIGWFGISGNHVGYRFSVSGKYGNVIIEIRSDCTNGAFVFRSEGGTTPKYSKIVDPYTDPNLFMRVVANRTTLFFEKDFQNED